MGADAHSPSRLEAVIRNSAAVLRELALRYPEGVVIRSLFFAVLLLLFALTSACHAPRQSSPQPLPEAEAAFQQLLDLRDQIDVTRFRGASHNLQGWELDSLVENYRDALRETRQRLEGIAAGQLDAEARRLVESMRERAGGLPEETPQEFSALAEEDPCEDLKTWEGDLDAWLSQTYACFGYRAHRLELDGRLLDRLTILERLTREEDPGRRRALFFALQPLWEAMHPGGPASPYRRILALSAQRHRQAGTAVESSAALLGVPPETVEAWLVHILETWRATVGTGLLEPWDYHYQGGEASRTLGDLLPPRTLRLINDRFYRSLGADPEPLGIHYDLDSRPGKDPVAFTTFGRRNREVDGQWETGEFWVFATYREGGLGNLAELLHETGHGVHLAAIRTRPAYQQWPDSDIFTEAVADLAAWEAFEPAWQEAHLGRSVPLAVSLRAKYSAVMLDIAWALFEMTLHRQPEQEPNQVWTELTSRYLGVRPHPELAWWALRGQLVSHPGYMLNYALGAILVADLRQELGRRLDGRPAGDWYAAASQHLFRWGLERPAAEVIREFLGRPPSPEALRDDLSRR